jgi:uncharacterized protein YggE
MAEEAGVMARGRAEREVAPDRATWHVEVRVAGDDEVAAYEQCARRARGVVDALAAAAGADGRVTLQSVYSGPRYAPDGSGPQGFEATAALAVDAALAARSGIGAAALEAGATSVAGPNGYVSQAAGIEVELMEAAVAAARTRAAGMARGLGRELGEPLAVREAAGGGARLFAARAESADLGAVADLPPQTVAVEVEVTFALG